MLSLILVLFLSHDGYAQKSRINTDIYAKEPEKIQSFTAKVKVIREVYGDLEVFFDGEKARGVYTIPPSAQASNFKNMFEKSKAPNGPLVKVTADSNKNIKSVQLLDAPAKSNIIPDNPDEMWNYGPIPD